MIATTVTALVVLLLACFLVLVGAAMCAPDGYEDETGFHDSSEARPAAAMEALVLRATVVETGPVKAPVLHLANQHASDHAHGAP
jgi:hypothetical protein